MSGRGYSYLTGKARNLKYFFNQGPLLKHVVDRIKFNILPKYFIAPNFPTHIDIESSSLCQLKCPMCKQRLMAKEIKGNMNFDLYKKIIDECSRRRVYSIKLSWRGEPLMNPGIWDMVRYAKEKRIKDVAFLTNGERLKIKDIPKLVESGLNWISFSIDGLGKTYEKIRSPSKFEDIVEKLKAIKEYKERRNLKNPLVRIQTFYSAIKNNPKEYFDFFSPIVDRINVGADRIEIGSKDFPRDRDFICPTAWQRMMIAHNGIVAQCYDDYLLKNPMGNVNEKSLYEIWHDEPFGKFRKLQKTKQQDLSLTCRECPHRGLMNEKVLKIHDKKVVIEKFTGQDFDIKKINAKKLFRRERK